MHRVWGWGANQGQGKPASAQLLHQPRSQIPCNRTEAGMYQTLKQTAKYISKCTKTDERVLFIREVSPEEAVIVSSRLCTLCSLAIKNYTWLYVCSGLVRVKAMNTTYVIRLSPRKQGSNRVFFFLSRDCRKKLQKCLQPWKEMPCI